jgi:chaperonin GroES
MKFRPLHDRVVIRRLSADEKTSGGIIIPDTAQEKPMEGEVIAVVQAFATSKGRSSPSM